MEKKLYIQAELKKEGEKIVFIASDETLDRYNEVIPLDSWDLTKYKQNPVLLVNHEYTVQSMVGKAKNLKIQDVKNGKKALTFEPTFHGITELSKQVEAMVKEGVLNTVSVGFMRRAPSKDGDREKNELLEISFVPVPANPGAHQLEVLASKSLEEGEKELIEKFISAEEVVEEPEPAAKKKATLKEKVQKAKSALEDLADHLDEEDDDVEERSTDEDADDIVEENSVASEEKQLDTPELGKVNPKKTLSRGNKKIVKVLKRVAKQVNHALYQAHRS